MSSELLNLVLVKLYDRSARVEVTQGNIDQLRRLCTELGFSELDEQLREFQADDQDTSLEEVLLLKQRIARQDKLLAETRRQLNNLLSWKRKSESLEQRPVPVVCAYKGCPHH